MIIVKLFGGLGNQLFQYALGRSLSLKNNVPLKLDLFAFAAYTLRQFSLDPFHIQADIATAAEISKLTGAANGYKKRLIQFSQRLVPYYKRSSIKEPHFHFDKNILRAPHNVYLSGYWQSEKYFKDYEKIIRKELIIKFPPNDLNAEIINRIENVDSISIHVRRGDYQSLNYIEPCSLEYYKKAINYILRVVQEPHFYIFSDDPDWSEKNLSFLENTTFVKHNQNGSDIEDLRLMSKCKHHIIANSTFSWWGAWLSTRPNKVIVAPQNWFKEPTINAKDLVPQNWHTL